ncbi:TetR/AcrR family transcriptional regulator [Saccharopolyspora erythraea]|uniref:TetR/AcrR family transcriptional regulator n=1 Tax=Saccharopolyspora erythraea TaxID=1836 RepID=UPI003D802B09
MTDGLPRILRSDAHDNRERILDAARALFAAEGLNVPMREIARRAGVGPATVYRRFPTKRMLVAEVFAGQVRVCRALVDEGTADPDPWRGFRLVIEKTCEMHARDRGFTEAFMSACPDAEDLASDREHALKAVAEVARRAKATGNLRPDFVLDDLVLMLMANRGIRAGSTAARGRGFPALRRVRDPGVPGIREALTATTSGTAGARSTARERLISPTSTRPRLPPNPPPRPGSARPTTSPCTPVRLPLWIYLW